MPINLQSFVNTAKSAIISSRDITIQGKGENATAKLGNYVFSAGKTSNAAVMAAFKSALEREYGVFGTHAFDTILGERLQTGKSLRACDVKATLSRLESVKVARFSGELSRQLDTNPKFRSLSPELRRKIRSNLSQNPAKGVDVQACKSQADLAHAAVKRLDAAIHYYRTGEKGDDIDLDGRKRLDGKAGARQPTGLRNLKTVFHGNETSIEDRIKKGMLGSGMRVNRSITHPVLLDKLKTNGVEPGFIFRNDWSTDDTHGFMADINSPESKKALEDLKEKNPELAKLCEGKTLREQIMLAGRAHPAGMAAVAEFVLEEAVGMAVHPERMHDHPFENLAKALQNHFAPQDLKRLENAVSDPKNGNLLKEAKLELFTEIRDTVMNVRPGDDFHPMSPIFKHFSDRAIVKLDYNESTKFSSGDTASAGTFMRPERVAANRKMGQLYRFTSRQSADKISAGAVTEALANDLTRVAGVPAQELEIVRGKYSDGHPKIMLTAKFAEGYKDLEAGMLKDGRAVPPPPNEFGIPGAKPEPLGKYKAFFLVTADRDGIGKRGQNKGFVNGKFFAIDPGHSLEGNGKYLKVSDDLSFKDTYGHSSKPRFNNFSVFDDDTFFAKMEGVVNLRQRAEAGEFKKVFDDYRAAFDPKEDGISDAEKALRTKIWDDINKKEAEFNESLKKILDVSANNLALYDDLAADGPAIQQGAIETVANLEKLTSPTTWVSKKGQVALDHLEVIPDTRVPWKGTLKGDNLLFICETKLSWETTQLLEAVVEGAGGKCEGDALGVTRVTIPKDKAAQFFASFTEEQVQQLTHTAEYTARKDGRDGLKEAKTWTPVPPPPPQRPAPPHDRRIPPRTARFRRRRRRLPLPQDPLPEPHHQASHRGLPAHHRRTPRPPPRAGAARTGGARRADERPAAALRAHEPEHRRPHLRPPRGGPQEGRVHVPRLLLHRGQERRHRPLARQGPEPLHPHLHPRQALPVGAGRRPPQHAARLRRPDRRRRPPQRHEDVPLLHHPGRGRPQERRQRQRPASPPLPQVRNVRHLLLHGAPADLQQAGLRRRRHEDARIPVRRRPRIHRPRLLPLRLALHAEGGPRHPQGKPHQAPEGRHPVGPEQAPHEVSAACGAPHGGERPRRRGPQQDDRQHGVDPRTHAGRRRRARLDHGRPRLHVRAAGKELRQRKIRRLRQPHRQRNHDRRQRPAVAQHPSRLPSSPSRKALARPAGRPGTIAVAMQ